MAETPSNHETGLLSEADRKGSLGQLAALFLRLGLTAFGGPAAHIAMMEDEVVNRRRWLDRQRFLDLLGMTNLLPGPSSSELAIYIGQSQAGWAGLLLGGACFILPAALLTAMIAWAYTRFGSLPQATGILYGIRPVVVAIIFQALWRLGQTALKTKVLMIIAVGAAAASLAGLGPVWILLCCGTVVLAKRSAQRLRSLPAVFGFLPTTAIITHWSLGNLFLVFLKLGAVVFGSGYVLLAFLRADLVDRLHWLTEKQLLDAIAVGQITPGPVFSTATFIGYILAGGKGAVLATVAIFLPAFILVAFTGPLLPRLRKSKVVSALLDGVNAGSLGLMLAVVLFLACAAIVNLATALAAIGSAILLLRFKVNPTWLIFAGAAFGIINSVLHVR
jgi:chromate transporter